MNTPPGYDRFSDLSSRVPQRFRLSPDDVWYFKEGGSHEFDRHYTYHTAWAARKIQSIRPEIVNDFSSLLYFSTLVSAFVPVNFHDIRPISLGLQGLKEIPSDLTRLNIESESLRMVTCMHVVEHIGLGRYGDDMDAEGDLKAINSLKRITTINGDLIFVVPVGGLARVVYNAHRIYTYEQVLQYFNDFSLVDFSLVTDISGYPPFIENATPEQSKKQSYGCGCFHFKKDKRC